MSEDILNRVLDGALVLQTGERILAIIHARTLRGEFLPGSSTAGYSTKPAPMPFGGLAERVGKGTASRVLRAIENGNGEDAVYMSKTSGKMWLTLSGGYKRLRELSGRETDRVTLNWKGSMLRALKAKADPSVRKAVIYFTDAESEKIAGFHHQGAGRSKIKRMFLGLTQQEQEKIEKWLGEQMTKKFRFEMPKVKT